MSPRRPDLSAALERGALGREAVYGRPEPEPPTPPPPARRAGGRPPAPAGTRWEDRVKRATFHVPVDVLAAARETSQRMGESLSAFVAAAIAERVAANPPPPAARRKR